MAGVLNSSVDIPEVSIPPQVDNLPDAYKHQFFDKPENWSDIKMSKWIGSNPIVDLCLRLATYQQAPGRGCFDPKGQVFGSKRLFQMIGNKLPRGTFKRMCLSSSRQYKFVEECWIANMHTVLLNQYFDPVRRDRKLFKSIQRYKLWFVEFAFSGRTKTVTKKDGKKIKVFVPINSERLLKGLKSIAGCLQWAALSDMKEHNAPPPSIPYWKGYHSEIDRVELIWFSGHLERWSSCLINLKFTDRDLANLCQIRTFGRALPCPTIGMCREAFTKQVGILTTRKDIDPKVLSVVNGFSTGLGKKLGVREMPTHTHVSVSTSGCFERSQRDGGLAAEVGSWISKMDVSFHDVYIGPSMGPGSFPISLAEYIDRGGQIINLRDVYGEMLFPRPKSFFAFSLGLNSISLKKKQLSFLEALYGGSGLSAKRRKASKLIGEESLPAELGKSCLLYASALALLQGEYLSDIDERPVSFSNYLFIEGVRIPVVTDEKMRRHLIYRPISMPKTKLDCLAEPGAKTRPLGKNQAWFTLVTRAMRFMAEPIIARDGRARIGLRSTNKMWSFLKYLKGVGSAYGDPIAHSADYESATDLIALAILAAIWDGFLKSLPKSHPFWVFEKLISCQRSLFFAGKYKFLYELYHSGILNECGSFMGEPMSFLTLTLENLLVEEISDYYYVNPFQRIWSKPTSYTCCGRNPCCICGDDVAALRDSLRRVLLFREVAIDMGWKFSWKEGVSRRVMIFCEDHAILTGKKDKFKVVYADVIKSRLLTTMSREHSDNRSSILGKGRMLSNQLDYFENKNLKISIIGYFRNIFDRCFHYGVIHNMACKMPIYLPPSAGGMGFPIVESLMPSFMWPFIGHVFKTLDIKDEAERYCALEALKSLNSRVKHGFSADTSEVLLKVFREFKKAKPGSSRVSGNTIYDDDFVITLLTEVYSIEMPLDPYLKKYDFSSLKNEASRIGFVPLSSLAEEIERVLNFQKFLKNGVDREPRTFNKWLKDSKRYWNKNLFKTNEVSKMANLGRSRFKDIVSLERAITRGFSGWIYAGSDLEHFNLINSGPSLKVSFSRATTMAGRLVTNMDHAPTD